MAILAVARAQHTKQKTIESKTELATFTTRQEICIHKDLKKTVKIYITFDLAI